MVRIWQFGATLRAYFKGSWLKGSKMAREYYGSVRYLEIKLNMCLISPIDIDLVLFKFFSFLFYIYIYSTVQHGDPVTHTCTHSFFSHYMFHHN